MIKWTGGVIIEGESTRGRICARPEEAWENSTSENVSEEAHTKERQLKDSNLTLKTLTNGVQ